MKQELRIMQDRVPSPDEDMIHRAQRTICHYAADADEARELMQMCGVLPRQEWVG